MYAAGVARGREGPADRNLEGEMKAILNVAGLVV